MEDPCQFTLLRPFLKNDSILVPFEGEGLSSDLASETKGCIVEALGMVDN